MENVTRKANVEARPHFRDVTQGSWGPFVWARTAINGHNCDSTTWSVGMWIWPNVTIQVAATRSEGK